MAESPDIDILARGELFRGVPVEVLRELHAASFRRKFPAGETVFQAMLNGWANLYRSK